MHKLVVMPRELHSRLLATCDQKSREYECLANAFIVQPEGDQEAVQIPCDSDTAELIVNIAASNCPEIVSAIKLLNQSH